MAEDIKPFEIGQLLGDISARLASIEKKVDAAILGMNAEVRELSERVRSLEDDRMKARTVAAIFGGVLGFIVNFLWFIGQFLWDKYT